MKCLKSFLIIILLMFNWSYLISENNISISFPQFGRSDISRFVTIELNAPFPIDTSTLNSRTPYNPDSTFKDELPLISLIKDAFIDSLSDSTIFQLSIPCHLKVVDSTKLYLSLDHYLDYNSTYAIKISDKIKLLKPDTTKQFGIDTVFTNDTTYRSIFTTIDYPLYYSSVSIQYDGAINCDDSITIKLSKPFYLSQSRLDDIFTILKIGDAIIDTSTNYITYEMDTVNYNVSMATDSMRINITPQTSYSQGEVYFLNSDMSSVIGTDQLNFTKKFQVLDKAIYKVTTAPFDTSYTLPIDCMEYDGWGERAISANDTTFLYVPFIVEDYYFRSWSIDSLLPYVTINNNMLVLHPGCGDLQDLNNQEIFAYYKKIPIDTLEIDTVEVLNLTTQTYRTDTCSRVVVKNFVDSLSKYQYTYKRYNEHPLMLEFIACDEVEFDHWESVDYADLDDDEEPLPMIQRSSAEEVADEARSRYLDPYGKDGFITNCTQSSFVIKIEKEYSPDDGTDLTSIFGTTLQVGGQQVTLTGTSNEVEGTVVFQENPKNATAQGTIQNSDYEIAAIYHYMQGIVEGTRDRWNFDRNQWVGSSFSRNMDVQLNTNGCQDLIIIYIRKIVYEYKFEITHSNGKHIPSLNTLDIKFSPIPSTAINKPLFRVVSSSPSLQDMHRLRGNYPIRTFAVDANGKSYVEKVTMSYYYYIGDVVELSPWVRDKSGYASYDWNESSGYTYEIPMQGTNKISVTIDSDKKSNHIFSSLFMLESIGIYKTRNNQTVSGEDGGDEEEETPDFVYYKVDPIDAQTEDKIWKNNTIISDDGMGLLYRMPDPHPSHIRPYHLFNSKIRFTFSEEVLSTSIPGNIIIRDGPYIIGIGKRADDNSLMPDYGIRFTGNKPNATKIELGRTVEITLQSEGGTGNPPEQWMCHMQEFQILIKNYTNGAASTRIRSAVTGEALSNIQHAEEATPNKFLGITALPGVVYKSDYFKNLSDDDDCFLCGVPDVTIYLWAFMNNINHANKSTNDRWELDDEGRVNYKIESINFPTGGTGEVDLDPDEDNNNDKYEESIIIFAVDQLTDGSFLDIGFEYFDNNDAPILSDFIKITFEIISFYLGSRTSEEGVSEEQQQTWNTRDKNIADKIKEWILTVVERDDRQMGVTRWFFGRDDLGLNSSTCFWLPKWYYDNWGAGKYGLYLEKYLYAYHHPRVLQTRIKIILGDISGI